MKKGFAGASLRSIAQAAETSTRAVYTRFPGKEGLFGALVAQTAQEFKDILRSSSAHAADGGDSQRFDLSGAQGYLDLMAYVYDRYDDFVLILLRSQGTSYEGYVDELAAISMASTEALVERVAREESWGGEVGADAVCDKLLEQLITKSFFACMFEPVARGLSRADALRYMENLYCFTKSGIAGVLEMAAEKQGRRAARDPKPRPSSRTSI